MADYKTYRAYKSPDPPSYGEAVTRARRFLEGCIAGNGQGLLKNRSLAAPRDYQAMNSEVLGAAMLRTRPALPHMSQRPGAYGCHLWWRFLSQGVRGIAVHQILLTSTAVPTETCRASTRLGLVRACKIVVLSGVEPSLVRV